MKHKILDPRNLPYFGAIVQAVLFSVAGNVFFPYFGWLIGLGVGAVVNWSMALASSRVSDVAKNRKLLSYGALTLLMCLSPVVICSTLGWTMATFAWALAPDLAILLTGSIVGKGLVAEIKPKEAKPKRTKPATKPEPAEEEPAKPAYVCKVAGCTAKPFATQSALNAHGRKHKSVVGYNVSFEPVVKEEPPR